MGNHQMSQKPYRNKMHDDKMCMGKCQNERNPYKFRNLPVWEIKK